MWKEQGKNRILIVIGVIIAFILCIGIFGNSDNTEYQDQNEYTITFMNNGEQIEKVTVNKRDLLEKQKILQNMVMYLVI